MLNWNLWHTWEHYGNVVVYLRIKGLVPPSTMRRHGKCREEFLQSGGRASVCTSPARAEARVLFGTLSC